MSCCQPTTADCVTIVYSRPVPETIIYACLPPMDQMVLRSLVSVAVLDSPDITVETVVVSFDPNSLVCVTAIQETRLGQTTVIDSIESLASDTVISQPDLGLIYPFSPSSLSSVSFIFPITLAIQPEMFPDRLLSLSVISSPDITITSNVFPVDSLVSETLIQNVDLSIKGVFDLVDLDSDTVVSVPSITPNTSLTVVSLGSDTAILQPAFVLASVMGMLFDDGVGGLFDAPGLDSILVIGTGDDMLLVGTGEDSLVVGADETTNLGWISDGEV